MVSANSSPAVAVSDGKSWRAEPVTASVKVLGRASFVRGPFAPPAFVGNAYAAGKPNGVRGVLVQRSGATWSEVALPSSANGLELTRAWSAAPERLLVLAGPNGVVLESGAGSWTHVNLPLAPAALQLFDVWGMSDALLISGWVRSDDGVPRVGVLLLRDTGEFRAVKHVPSEAVALRALHGTSLDDVFIVADGAADDSIVYHVTKRLTLWTVVARSKAQRYGAIWSPRAGHAVALGCVGADVVGCLRVSTLDHGGIASEESPDKDAPGPGRLWMDASGKRAHVLSNPLFGATASVHYTADCQ